MSERNAKVRLELAAAGFLSMMKQLEAESGKLAKELEGIGKESEKAEKKLHPMLQSAKKGLGAARSAASGLGSTLKSTLTTALTLGGALSLGGGIKTALTITDQYKHIAFAIRTGTGEAMRWEQVQETVQGTAKRWSRANDEVAASYHSLFQNTGNLEFAKKATDEISKVATATGTAIEPLRNLAAELHNKFGITNDDLAETLAHMVQLGNQGDTSLEQLGSKMGEIGASAKLLGLEGRDGLQHVVGMLNVATRGGGNFEKALQGVAGLLDQLADPKRVKELEKQLKVKLTTEDGGVDQRAIQKIIEGTGGQRELLAKVFSGDQLKFLTDFGSIYNKAFDEAEGSFKQRSEAAAKAFEAAVQEETKQRLTAADMEEEAKRRREDVSRKLTDVMNTFVDAFAKPETIAAMEKVVDRLVKFDKAIGPIVDFAVNHPLLAGAAFMGASPAMAFGQSMAGDAASAGLKRLLKMGKGEAKTIAKTFATEAAKSGAWSAAGSTIGSTFSRFAGSRFARIAGPALAGYIAYEITKSAIDKRIKTKETNQNDIVGAEVQAHAARASGNRAQMIEAEKNLREKITKMREDQDGFGGGFDKLMGGLVTIMPKALGGDPNFVSPEQQMLSNARQELRQLQEALKEGAGSGENAAGALDKTAASAANLANQLDNVMRSVGGGGRGSNGLPSAPAQGNWWD